MRRTTLVLTLASAFAAPRLAAQLPAPMSEMLRRLFASREFAPERFGPARWIDGGAAYTTVEPSADLRGGSDIGRYETATRARTVYVTARELGPPRGARALHIDHHTL